MDFASGTLSFGDRTIHTYRRTLGRVCRQVVVSEDYIVPAHHEGNVPIKMSDKDVPHLVDDWVIETKQLSSRVMTMQTLINGNQKRLIARVCNYSDEPFELKADCYLACTEPMECVPGPDGKLSGNVCNDSNGMLSMSVLPGTTAPSDLSPTAGRDLTTILCVMTVRARWPPAPKWLQNL